jgi:small-conductance mechanosensitive channel
VLAPVSFERIEKALSGPAGWVELGLVVLCFAAGWLLDRAILSRKREGVQRSGLVKGAARIAMPVAALVLLYVGRIFWRPWGTPLFFDVGVVLALALAAIRILVFTLRRLVPNALWLKSSERTVAFVVWTLVALHMLGVTPELAQELDSVRLPLGRAELTLLSLLKGIVAVLLTIAITLWVAGLVESRLMKTDLDLSQKALASKFVKAVLVVIGVLIALQSIGLDLTVLSVFGGALGVGIGLGLQKLASNYIAGFVILLDRSIRLGDLVTVGDRYGTVTKVTSRYVVVRSLDSVEAIVPNETMVTTTVLNHSLSAREARVATQIQVAYGTDLEKALDLLVHVARTHPRVETSADRAPAAFVLRFADSGIDLELGVWILDPEIGQLGLKSDLNLAIWKAFQQHGISVPFPQREVRILGAPVGVPVGVPAGAAGGPAPA